MPHHLSAKKMLRRDAKHRLINKSRMSTIRTFVKNCKKSLEGKDASGDVEALKKAQSHIARGAARGVMHKNTAARKIGRLMKRYHKLNPSES